MKRLWIAIIVFMVAGTSLSADTAYNGTGSLESDFQASVDVGFLYDPATMHRVSFGFSGDADVDWEGPRDDYSNRIFPLNADMSVSNGARGVGDLNFYWILRTSETVSARIYLAAPLRDEQNGIDLDWKIVFDAMVNDRFYGNESLDSLYGPENAVLIFRREADPEMPVSIGSVPMHIETRKVDEGLSYSFSGTIGVLIENR